MKKFIYHFADRIIYRGLEYHINERVLDLQRLGLDIITGKVLGSQNQIYDVKIDLNEPHASTCSCPYASDGSFCKHMAAVYFEAFPEEAFDYCEEEDEEWFDDYDEDDSSDFVVPLNFDKLLDNFIDSLSETKKNDLLKKLLEKDKERTFNTYLKADFEQMKEDYDIAMKEKIHNHIEKTINNNESYGEYVSYQIDILDDEQKAYLQEGKQIEFVRELLFDQRLYAYNDHVFLVNLAKKYLKQNEIEILKKRLIDYFELLKTRGLKSLPKSHVLMSIYELDNHEDVKVLADDLLQNMKYMEYVFYVIDHYDEPKALFKTLEEKCFNSVKNHNQYARVFDYFAKKLNSDEAEELSYFYGFLYNGNLCDFDELVACEDFKDTYYPLLVKKGNSFVKKNIYAKLNQKKELYDYLVDTKDIYGLRFYASFLDDPYHDELLKLFKDKVYEQLSISNNRKDYAMAADYVSSIRNLKDGQELVKELIDELRRDERYRRRSALFDEFYKILQRS